MERGDPHAWRQETAPLLLHTSWSWMRSPGTSAGTKELPTERTRGLLGSPLSPASPSPSEWPPPAPRPGYTRLKAPAILQFW